MSEIITKVETTITQQELNDLHQAIKNHLDPQICFLLAKKYPNLSKEDLKEYCLTIKTKDLPAPEVIQKSVSNITLPADFREQIALYRNNLWETALILSEALKIKAVESFDNEFVIDGLEKQAKVLDMVSKTLNSQVDMKSINTLDYAKQLVESQGYIVKEVEDND